MDALQLKGTRRDNEALSYLCGFTAALEATGHPDKAHLERVLVMLIATRGFAEVKRTAEGTDE
jgi:hypothetical protein